MKQKITVSILLMLIAITFSDACLSQGAGNATSSPDHITLTWTSNPSTTMTITWRTDSKISTGSVEYQNGTSLITAEQHKAASLSNFTTDLQATHLFTATLTGLTPNTKYWYRVGGGGHWSKTNTFTTEGLKTKAFKFLVFGDSQSSTSGEYSYSVWHNTLHHAYSANQDARFIVNIGDLVDVGQSGAHWNCWFAAAAGVIDRVPEMPVTGNHETYGSTSVNRPAYWDAQFRLPHNGPMELSNQVYSYDYGPVHFVVLDSQQSEEKQYGDILTPQKRWLEADLAASKATWKIVFFHKGAYSIKFGRDNKDIRDAFTPVIDKNHVDMVFNGHDHGVARSFPIKNGVFMPKPSEGTVYYIAGHSGSKSYIDLYKRDWCDFFYNPLDQPNYIVVDVTPTKLTVKTLKTDGTPIDAFFIDKKNDILATVKASQTGTRK